MGTIREYFDTDVRVLSSHKDWQLNELGGTLVATVAAKIAYDFEANAKYWYFFIPSGGDAMAWAVATLNTPETQRCELGPDGDEVYVESGFRDYSERQDTSTVLFTRRVHLYMDAEVPLASRRELVTYAQSKGLFVAIKDREYALKRTETEKPLAFISHDFRDKEVFVRDLALELTKLMCPVWYDEYSLMVGDSLREKIEDGLKEARKCVLVLSPNFLANKGWGKAEFDSIFTREIVEGKNVILPVWHNITKQELYEFSPRLVDKVGLQSSLGVPEVARQLNSAIKARA